MRRTVLLKMSVLVEIDSDEVAKLEDSEFCEIDRIEKRLANAINRELGLDDAVSQLGWQQTRPVVLDEQTMNCGRCAICEAWVSDCEKPDRIAELGNAATVDGKLLCDEHLPRGHRWAF